MRNAVIMGATLRNADDLAARPAATAVGIGDNTVIEGPSSTRTAASAATCASPTSARPETTTKLAQAIVRDGIVVVPKDAILEDGWSLRRL